MHILWIPGTSNHQINPAFAAALPAGTQAELVNYMASWQLDKSIPNGIACLERAINKLERHFPQKEIELAGESQGAIVIASVLAQPRYRKLISRAVLLGNPGIDPIHFGPNDRYLEIDHRCDPATFKWPDAQAIPLAIDKLLFDHDLAELPFFTSLLLRHPMQAAISGFFALRHVPWLASVISDPHNYSKDMPQAVEWLLS